MNPSEKWATIFACKSLQVARGPLVKQLGLNKNDAFCSRNEFTLLTLVLQGKLSEGDLQECRERFDALDEDGTGRLSVEDLELVRQRKLLQKWVVPQSNSFRACGRTL